MGSPTPKRRPKGDKKVRVAFRRNRSARRRQTNWTKEHREGEEGAVDSVAGESLTGKGDLSRRRTVTIHENPSEIPEGLTRGTVIALRGLFADVDDGERILPCTVRRVLRTRLVEERHPVTVGDHVLFRLQDRSGGVVQEGVIEVVLPRSGQLRRRVRRRIQTLVANVDQVVIVSSADQPSPKPHLIDRYIVAARAGEIIPIICMNKSDLDTRGFAAELLERYVRLGYETLCTSTLTGEGIDSLRAVLQNKASVIAGQSGVGKSSLLNVLQPGLQLATGDITEQTSKGKHTTSTAVLIRLEIGGYVVDTPGIRSFDLSTVARNEFEAHFIEFLDHVPNCKFPDCTHTHESGCAVIEAVEQGDIHPERYESYVRLFTEPTQPEWESRLAE